MIKKIVILPDAHLTTTSSKTYKVVKKFVKTFKPHETIILGDFMDVSALSGWDMDKKLLMEGRRFKKEVEFANKELDYLLQNSKKVTYLGGNHLLRIYRYVEKHPELEGLIEPEVVLDFKNKGIEYIPYDSRKYYRVGKLWCHHGIYTNDFHTKKMALSLGANSVSGHLHRPQSYMLNMKLREPIMAYSLGCLCEKEPDYLNGRPSNWMQGFGVAYIDSVTGNFNLYPINIINNSFIWYGKKYK